MKIQLKEWLRISQLQKEAREAAERLENESLALALQYEPGPERELLLELARHIETADESLAAMSTWPQSEWMGGPTEGKGSERTKTYLREPCCVGLDRRYFSAKEVEEAREAGVLRSGRDVTGPKGGTP